MLQINVKTILPVGKNMQDHLEFFLQHNINMSLNTNSENFARPRRILNYVFNKKGISIKLYLKGNFERKRYL